MGWYCTSNHQSKREIIYSFNEMDSKRRLKSGKLERINDNLECEYKGGNELIHQLT